MPSRSIDRAAPLPPSIFGRSKNPYEPVPGSTLTLDTLPLEILRLIFHFSIIDHWKDLKRTSFIIEELHRRVFEVEKSNSNPLKPACACSVLYIAALQEIPHATTLDVPLTTSTNILWISDPDRHILTILRKAIHVNIRVEIRGPSMPHRKGSDGLMELALSKFAVGSLTELFLLAKHIKTIYLHIPINAPTSIKWFDQEEGDQWKEEDLELNAYGKAVSRDVAKIIKVLLGSAAKEIVISFEQWTRTVQTVDLGLGTAEETADAMCRKHFFFREEAYRIL